MPSLFLRSPEHCDIKDYEANRDKLLDLPTTGPLKNGILLSLALTLATKRT